MKGQHAYGSRWEAEGEGRRAGSQRTRVEGREGRFDFLQILFPLGLIFFFFVCYVSAKAFKGCRINNAAPVITRRRINKRFFAVGKSILLKFFSL